MFRRLLLVSVILCSVTVRADVRWFGNADRAFEAAAKKGGLVMLDLLNVSVQGGGSFLTEVYPNQEVQEALSDFAPLRLRSNADGKAYVDRYKVASYPTVLFLTPRRKVVWRISGPTGPGSFLRQLEKARSMKQGVAAYERAARTRQGTAEQLGGAATMAGAANEIESAEMLLDLALAKDPKAKVVRVADACNMVGDSHQTARRFAKAIPLFQRAASSSNDDTRAYALISVASCYLTMQQRDKALPWLRKLVAMGKRGGELTVAAQRMINGPRN